MDKVGKLEKIQYCEAKGKKPIVVREISIKPNVGIEEDYHSLQGDVNITVWDGDTRRRLESEGFDGLCFLRFNEHLSISGLDFSELEAGKRLRIGPAELIIIKKGKACHPECRVNLSGDDCPLRSTIVYVQVLKEGSIKLGDEVRI